MSEPAKQNRLCSCFLYFAPPDVDIKSIVEQIGSSLCKLFTMNNQWMLEMLLLEDENELARRYFRLQFMLEVDGKCLKCLNIYEPNITSCFQVSRT